MGVVNRIVNYNEDVYIESHEEYETEINSEGLSVMGLLAMGLGVLVALVLLAALIHCLCRRGNRGRVLAPPETVPVPAPYPQQQYHQPAPYIAPVPAAMPTAGGYYPAPYPVHVPLQQASDVSPYPPVPAAPYPTVASYPHPSAPANACPPSYAQVMGDECKQPPYNPSAPH